MTIGIGGWGSRRKPIAFIRALLRTDVTDLTVVTYGGPDPGPAIARPAGQKGLLRLRVAGLAAVLRPVVRQGRTKAPSRPARWTRACCAADCRPPRLPFLPIQAGLGSDVEAFLG